MTEKKPPAWGNDPLSIFFSDAEYNNRAVALKYPMIYTLLQRVHATFQGFEEAIEKDEKLLVSRFLMARTHSAFLAAIRLSMSGQILESFPVLRAAIEEAWYALHIAKDPAPPERAKVWLCRNDDKAAKSKCRSEFTVANVRSTHEGLDPATAKELQEQYEALIDFGAHPNQLGVLMSMSKSQTDNTYNVGILFPEHALLVFALRMAVRVAVYALKIFQLIFPVRFALLEIDLGIERLVQESNAVFKLYVPQTQDPGTTG